MMAWQALKQMDAPALVSRAEIDASKKSVTAATGCRVEHLEVTDGTVRFDRLDDALPMPVDVRAEPALALAPVLTDLDRFELRVSGLPDGTYAVTIDGEAAGKVGADVLRTGWNLANAGGPITKQSREVLQLVFRKNELYFNRWRNVQLYSFPNWAKGADLDASRAAELKRLDGEIAEAEVRLDALRKPVIHRFEIKPAQ